MIALPIPVPPPVTMAAFPWYKPGRNTLDTTFLAAMMVLDFDLVSLGALPT